MTRPFVIVAAVDGSALTEAVLDATAVEAERHRGSRVHLCHVLEDAHPPPIEPFALGLASAEVDERLEDGKTFLERARTYLGERTRTPVEAHASFGAPWREIVRISEEYEADLVIVGTHGRTGLERALVGSVAETVVRHATCPVLVVRTGPEPASARAEASVESARPH